MELFNQSITQKLSDLTTEINHLATDDLGTVARSIKKTVVNELAENPYFTLALAIGVGFGLGALNSSHLKKAIFQVGKLVALRSLASI